MEFADLLANLGGTELTKEEKKRAIKWGLLNMGAGMLANNRGNYGEFAPALGAGINQGLLGYQTQLGREEAGAKKRKQTELMRNAFTSAITPGQSFQQIGSQGNSYITGDKSVADMIAGQNEAINWGNSQPVEPPVQTFGMGFTPPPVGTMTEGSEMPFNANRPRIPGQNVTRPPEPMTEAEQGLYGMTPVPPPQMPSAPSAPMLPTDYQSFSTPEQFDMLKAARQLMQSGDPELMQEGFKIYAELKANKGDGPFGKVMPQNYTPESLQQFAQTGDYSVLKPTRAAGSGFGNVNPGQFTPESLAVYAQSGNYADLVPFRAPVKIDAGNEDILVDPVTNQVIGRYPKQLAPAEAAAITDRRTGLGYEGRKLEYETPAPKASNQPQSFSVTAPDGKTYTFPTKKAADNFRMSIGGK